jgi:hypothetical protein
MKTDTTVLSAPSEVFRRMETRPTWRLAFLAVVIGNVLLTWLKSCLRGSSFVIDLSVIFGSFISISVILLALWSMLSLFLYFYSILLNAQKGFTYRIVFSLVSYCGIIFLVGECVNFILLRLGLLKSTSLMLPNRFPVGLDLLLIGKSPSLSLVVLLHSINPFTIWYFATIAVGISMLGGIGKRKAVLVAVSAWAIGVAFALLLLSVLGGTSIRIKAG